MGIVFPCKPLLRRVWLEISTQYRAWRLELEGSVSRNFRIRYAMCFLESQGWSPDHPDPLILSFILTRASKLSRTEPVMVCVMIKIYSKFNFEKRKKRTGMEPYTCILIHTVIVYCI